MRDRESWQQRGAVRLPMIPCRPAPRARQWRSYKDSGLSFCVCAWLEFVGRMCADQQLELTPEGMIGAYSFAIVVIVLHPQFRKLGGYHVKFGDSRNRSARSGES